jgi:hypothetical protein
MVQIWPTDWFYLHKKVYSDFKVIGFLLPIRILVKFYQTKPKQYNLGLNRCNNSAYETLDDYLYCTPTECLYP